MTCPKLFWQSEKTVAEVERCRSLPQFLGSKYKSAKSQAGIVLYKFNAIDEKWDRFDAMGGDANQPMKDIWPAHAVLLRRLDGSKIGQRFGISGFKRKYFGVHLNSMLGITHLLIDNS
jgi:hypothetical protein